MDMFARVRKALDGYKMYIVALGLLFAVFVETGLGWDIPGVEVGPDWMAYVWSAFGLGAWRSAVAKV